MSNHRLGSTLTKIVTDGFAIVTFITTYGFKTRSLGTGFATNSDRIEQGVYLSGFVLLAWRDGDRDGMTCAFAKHMNLGGVASATLPKALSLKAFFTAESNAVYVFFAPAAAL